MPFHQHDAWINAPSSLRDTCLSYAWGMYNLKTIYIECDIVTPACEDFLKYSPILSSDPFIIQEVISEALLDEALHTKMSIMASNFIYQKRNLQPLSHIKFNLIEWRDQLLNKCTSDSARRLTKFAIACASETLITDYLRGMTKDSSIQKICIDITKTHSLDEARHSSVFSHIAFDVIQTLTKTEKAYFCQVMRKTTLMFTDNELPAWASIFKRLNFPNYQEIIFDTNDNNQISAYLDSTENVISKIGLESNSNQNTNLT